MSKNRTTASCQRICSCRRRHQCGAMFAVSFITCALRQWLSRRGIIQPLPYRDLKMNVKQAMVAAVVFAAAGSVLAGNVNPFPDQRPVVSTKTRAEVKAELAQARAQGWVTGGNEPNYPIIAPTPGTRSREEVKAEAIKTAKNRQRNPDYDGQ